MAAQKRKKKPCDPTPHVSGGFIQLPVADVEGDLTLSFSIKFKRTALFFDANGSGHTAYTQCYHHAKPPPRLMQLNPIEIADKDMGTIEKEIAKYRRIRTQLSIAIAMADAEFDYTVSKWEKELVSRS